MMQILSPMLTGAQHMPLPIPGAGRLQRVMDFLLGTSPPPQHWAIQNPSVFSAEAAAWKRIKGGAVKQVFFTRARISGRWLPVVVKLCNNATLSHREGMMLEVLYLEYLRGHKGVPLLLGGYFDISRIRSVVAVTAQLTDFFDVSARLETDPKRHNAGEWRFRTSGQYQLLARSHPVELAIAILECFRSFSEIGGFFLSDFHPGQFVAAHSQGQTSFVLVDGPRPLTGDVARILGHNSSEGYAGPALAPVGACLIDADCPSTKTQHCCCEVDKASRVEANATANGLCGEDTPVGAAEARGLCNKAPSSGAAPPDNPTTLQGRCEPVSTKTHAFDVATKQWLLPLMAKYSRPVRDLLPLMSHVLPSKRLSFSAAIEFLQSSRGVDSARRRGDR